MFKMGGFGDNQKTLNTGLVLQNVYDFWTARVAILTLDFWLPLGPKLLHYITLFVSNEFPRLCSNCLHCRIGFELFSSYVMSCVVAKHTMWASDYITELFSNEFTGYAIYFYITELASN